MIRGAIAEGDGTEIRTEGDAFFAVFPTATGALAAAVGTQRGLAARAWPDGAAIRVRIGLHTGEGARGGDDYLGIDVNKAARIAAAGHGGQIVLSSTTAALTADDLPSGVTLRNLGSHLLKDFAQPEDLHDVEIDGLDDAFPPLRTRDPRRTVLPSPRTSFVGREPELVAVAQGVTSGRLTTLTGPGGSGKTRLAIEAAGAVQHRFSDGVVFVDLSAITDAALIAGEIGGALRLRQGTDADLLSAVRTELRDRRMLLVLDNMEQLAGGGADVVGEPPRRRPGPLGPRDEPDPAAADRRARDPGPPALPPRTRRNVPGRALVRRVDPVSSTARERCAPTSGWTRRTRARSSTSCRAWTRSARDRARGREAARARSRDPRRPARGSAADAHRRSARRARATPDPRRLDPVERGVPRRGRGTAYRGLSVFAGGWTLEAAEEVLGGDLDVWTGSGCSWRRAWCDGRATTCPSCASRCSRRSGSTRRRCSPRPSPPSGTGSSGATRRRSAWLAEAAEPHLTGEHQLEWLDRIGREHDNLRAVLDRAERTMGAEDVRDALVTAAAIWRFWQERGHMAEGRGRLERLLALPAAAGRDAVRARGSERSDRSTTGWATTPRWRGRYREAVAIARELGDPRLLSEALFNLSFEWFISGDPNDAIPRLEECLAIADERDVTLRARASMSIGYTHFLHQDLAAARAPIARAVELLRDSDERLARCEALVSLAAVEWVTGNAEAAIRRSPRRRGSASGRPRRCSSYTSCTRPRS